MATLGTARPWPVRALIALGLVLLAAYAVRAPFHWGGPRLDAIFGLWVYDAVAAIGMVLCAWRAIRVRKDRAVWSLIAIAFVLQVAGNTAYALIVGSGTPSVPSTADVLWISFYVPMIAALVLRVRAAGGARAIVTLDVLVPIGAIGAVSAAFVLDGIVHNGSSSTAALVTTLAYPVGDLVLIALVLHLAAAGGWRLGHATALMASCFVVWAVGDTLYASQLAHGTYVGGGLLDLGWVGPFALFGVAAWLRPDPPVVRQGPGWRTLAVPAGFGLVALGMVIDSSVVRGHPVALVLGSLSLVCVIVRFIVTFRSYLLVLGSTERKAFTDALTGLSNRRALTADLETVFARGQDAVLLLFDLDGFKSYNDAFGHPAGDALLARLGGRLRDAVGTAGTAYRMGGDEFCVLAGAVPQGREVIAARSALAERGEGFAITASQGRVAIPAEASNMAEALRIADQRMYRDKRSVRALAGEQAMRALLSVQSECQLDVGNHGSGVAGLAAEVARHLGVGDESVRDIRVAAELHDIGKLAIPDTIRCKTGPLDADEWALMRRHTLIGERIIASAEALSAAAKLVRSSHERWDGAGYPDGLAGDEIPLGARIISVCDAFDAMLADRPYSEAYTLECAIAELERCAGGQFDPRVVPLFVAVAHARAAKSRANRADRARALTPA